MDNIKCSLIRNEAKRNVGDIECQLKIYNFTGNEIEMTNTNSIDGYIRQFPEDIQVLLEQVRETIQKAAPQASEKISYQMPTFFLHKNLVHFAAYKNHIGFYPTPSAIDAFKKELTIYKTSKGAVQFPLDKPIPLNLITKMVKYRVKENLKYAPL